jgi:hypothetical protein
MIVGVLKAVLDHVVIHVLHDHAWFDAQNAELVELEPDQRAGGVLEQALVNLESNVPPGLISPSTR